MRRWGWRLGSGRLTDSKSDPVTFAESMPERALPLEIHVQFIPGGRSRLGHDCQQRNSSTFGSGPPVDAAGDRAHTLYGNVVWHRGAL